MAAGRKSSINMTALRRATLIKLLRLDFARLVVVMRWWSCARRGGHKCGEHEWRTGGRWGGFVVQTYLRSPRRWLRAPLPGGSTASVRGGTLLARSGRKQDDPRMFLGGEHNDGTRERGSMQRENSACLTIGTRRNVAGGKRKGEKGEGLAMFKSP